ncbi:MAG: hypothetical protein IT453_05345, partial [Planctomycetes bacterium]|nr:hypothetical protein [Planctomycetota bacterium]
RLDARLDEGLSELGERATKDHEHEQSLLREGLNELAELAERMQRELTAAVAGVAPRVEARLVEEAGALRAAREAEARANVAARKELQSELAELGRKVADELARLEERQSAALSRLDERLIADRHADRAELRDALTELGAATERVQRELAASVERIAPSLEARLRDEASALQGEMRESARGTSDALRELHAGLDALRTRVDQGVERLDGAQTTSLANLVQRMEIDRAYGEAELERGFAACTEASHRASRELAAGLAQLAPTLESALEARVAALHGGVQQAVHAAEDGANQLRARLEELGARFDHALGRIDGTQAAVLSELTGRLAADRMHGDLALRESLKTFEGLTERAHREFSAELARLAPAVGDDLRARIDALQAHLNASANGAHETAERLRADIESLGRRIEHGLRTRHESLAGDLLALAELGRESPEGARDAWEAALASPELAPAVAADLALEAAVDSRSVVAPNEPAAALPGSPAPVDGVNTVAPLMATDCERRELVESPDNERRELVESADPRDTLDAPRAPHASDEPTA